MKIKDIDLLLMPHINTTQDLHDLFYKLNMTQKSTYQRLVDAVFLYETALKYFSKKCNVHDDMYRKFDEDDIDIASKRLINAIARLNRYCCDNGIEFTDDTYEELQSTFAALM